MQLTLTQEEFDKLVIRIQPATPPAEVVKRKKEDHKASPWRLPDTDIDSEVDSEMDSEINTEDEHELTVERTSK